MWDDIFVEKSSSVLMKNCKTKFLSTAVSLIDFKTHFFKSWEEKDGIIPLRDVIARSFAAPYYFGTLVDETKKNVWMDGGSGESNTPLTIAYAEAINLGYYRQKVDCREGGS